MFLSQINRLLNTTCDRDIGRVEMNLKKQKHRDIGWSRPYL